MHVRNSLLFVSTFLFLAGCHSYAPRPLDLQAHAAEWRDRRADDPSVLAYLQSLREAALDGESNDLHFSPDEDIRLHHAEWIALLYNPDLRLARSDRAVAQALADHAGLWDDPEISLDVLHLLSGAAHPWTIGSTVSLTLPLSGRLEREKMLAAAEVEVALLRALEQERETISRLRQLWLEWSVLHHRIALIDDLLIDLESIGETARQLAELGEMLRTEAALFAIERTSREIERAVLVQLQGAAEDEVRRILGLPPEAPLRLKPQVTFAAAEEIMIDDHDELERMNPQLARLRAAYNAAEERLHLEVRRQYPDVTLGPQYEDESGQSRIGFIAGIPLPILNANRQGIAEAEAARERARAKFETAYEQIVGRMSALRRRIEAARLERDQIESRLAPLIDRQVSDARQLLDLGEGSPLALLEGVVRRHEAKVRALGAVANEGEAAIELKRHRGEAAERKRSTSTRQEVQP